MLALLKQHAASISALCERYGARRLELFGSAARGTFDPLEGDIDLIVDFEDRVWKGSFKR